MMDRSHGLSKVTMFMSVVCFCVLGVATTCIADSGHTKNMSTETTGHSDKDLPKGQRIVYGTVEGVNENSIKVNAGDAGEISPRYLELEKLGKKAEGIKAGDRVKITVNSSDNKVIDYELAKKTH